MSALTGLDADLEQFWELSKSGRAILCVVVKLNQEGAPATRRMITGALEDAGRDVPQSSTRRACRKLVDDGMMDTADYNGRSPKHRVTDDGRDVLRAGQEFMDGLGLEDR